MRHRWLLLILVAACRTAPKPEPAAPQYDRELPEGTLALVKTTEIPDYRPGFEQRDALREAVDHSLAYYAKPSSKKYFPYGEITHDQAVASLRRFREVLDAPDAEEFQRTLAREFDVYTSRGWDGSGTVFFTGYCAPIYDGSLEPTPEYRFPLYRRPADLVSDAEGTPLGRRTAAGVEPYPTRRQIEEGHLLDGTELVWLREQFEVYIVHIQGSARIHLSDGRMMEIGYAGKTDRPYASVGKALQADGKLRTLTLPAMKEHFRRHPEDLDPYLWRNESFVFFTETTGGPFGSLGVPVTPFASVATDKAVFPRGAMAFVKTTLPERGAYSAFALDQDTGGAIRSAGRCDLYLGVGPRAESLAGRVGQEGRLYYLFLKPDALPAGFRR